MIFKQVFCNDFDNFPNKITYFKKKSVVLLVFRETFENVDQGFHLFIFLAGDQILLQPQLPLVNMVSVEIEEGEVEIPSDL